MKKYIASISVLTLCAAAVIAVPTLSRAGDQANMGAETPKKADMVVYKGDVKSVDADAKTVTVGDLTLKISSDTKLTKDGQATTLADIKAGDSIHGHYRKADDGTLQAVSVHEG